VHVIGHRRYHDRFSTPVHFHPQPVQLGRRNPWLNLSLKRCIRDIAPDILHAQGNKAAQLASHMKPGKIRLRIGTVHGIKSSHRAFQQLDRVIAVSEQVFNNLEHPRKQLIFNGVSATPHSNQSSLEETLLPPARINVIAVGHLEPVKGFAALIEAWAQLPQQPVATQLTIFGDGSLRPELDALISGLGLGQQVSLAGFRHDLTGAYRQADLVVISSEREGFSYVLIESLLADCPVISTPVAGPVFLLPDCAISSDYRVGSLTDLLASALINLPALKAAEGSAIAFARKTLTLDHMTDETEQLYLDALAAPG
jgi:glycosyltransferase involved in cell wall biosynthesis